MEGKVVISYISSFFRFIFKVFGVILLFTVTTLLVVLPLFKENNIIGKLYSYIEKNETYLGLIFSILTIILTIWSVNKQIRVSIEQWNRQQDERYRDEQNRIEGERNRRELEEKQAAIERFVSNERELQKVRPTFMVNKVGSNGKESYKLDVYINDSFIDDVRIFVKSFSDKNDVIKSENIGTLQSGNINLPILNQDIEDIEFILILCKTIYQEQIYYFYYYGEVSFHLRRVISLDEIEKYKKYLDRKYLIEFIGIKEQMTERIEIYKETISQPAVKILALKRFVRTLDKIYRQDNTDFIDRISSDENLKIMEIIEEYNIGLLLGRTLNYIANKKGTDTREFYERILLVIQELLREKDIFVGNFPYDRDSNYFENNIGGWANNNNLNIKWFYDKYINFSDKMDKNFLLEYIRDFETLLNAINFQNPSEKIQIGFSSRNIEVFLNESVGLERGVESHRSEYLLDNYSKKISNILYDLTK